MKTIKLLLIFLLIGLYFQDAFSQVQISDSVNIKDFQTEVPYKKLLDREFTHILTGQSTCFGSFATLSTKYDIATLAGHIPLKEKANIGVNFSGGVTEGIVPLLNGEDVSSNIKVGLQLNLGIYKHKKPIIADATQILNFEKMEDSLFIATLKNRDKVEQDSFLLELTIRKKELEIKQKSRDLLKLNKIKETINDQETNSITIDSLIVLVWSIESEIASLKRDTFYLNQQVSNLTPTMRAQQKQIIETNKSKKYKKELQKLRLKEYNLKWFAIVTNFNNRSFNQFDISQGYDDQIKQKSFNRFELGINFNQYRLKDKSLGTFYFSAGAYYLLDDNFDDLTKQTVVNKKEISSSPNLRNIESTKTVYSGDYETNISKLKLNFNSYWFIGYNKVIAFHFNPSMRSDFKGDNKFDLITGLMVAFKNQEKKESIINAELFYNMKDIFHKSENEDDQFSDRSDIGIRLTFPITFIQNL